MAALKRKTKIQPLIGPYWDTKIKTPQGVINSLECLDVNASKTLLIRIPVLIII